MSAPAVERTRAALRARQDHLAAVVPALSADVLARQSGAVDWPVSQLLSHLGSGAEIMADTLAAALARRTRDPNANQRVWDRWNAMPPEEQARGTVEYGAQAGTAIEALSDEQLASVGVEIGFGPLPLPAYLGMRLNEVANHGWDLDVALDPDAEIDGDSAVAMLVDHLADDLGFLLGFIGKPANLPGPAVVDLAAVDLRLVIDDGVRLTGDALTPTDTLDGPPGAALRLLSGRLRPEHTPASVALRGSHTLDDLRAAFPGY